MVIFGGLPPAQHRNGCVRLPDVRGVEATEQERRKREVVERLVRCVNQVHFVSAWITDTGDAPAKIDL